MGIDLICYIAAALCFLLAAYPPAARSWMVPLGLFFFVLGHILSAVAVSFKG